MELTLLPFARIREGSDILITLKGDLKDANTGPGLNRRQRHDQNPNILLNRTSSLMIAQSNTVHTVASRLVSAMS
jgi:hypothetical protein